VKFEVSRTDDATHQHSMPSVEQDAQKHQVAADTKKNVKTLPEVSQFVQYNAVFQQSLAD